MTSSAGRKGTVSKRKLVTAAMVRAALKAAGESDSDHLAGAIEAAVEAAGPLIAEKALLDFAAYFETTAVAIGIDKHAVEAFAAIVRRSAKDARDAK